jgi:hypothetical protein
MGMYNPFLVSALKKCGSGDEVDAIFNRHRKTETDYKARIAYLGYCQGNPQVFFAGGAKKDEDAELYSKYLTVRSMFVTGSWR